MTMMKVCDYCHKPIIENEMAWGWNKPIFEDYHKACWVKLNPEIARLYVDLKKKYNDLTLSYERLRKTNKKLKTLMVKR